MQIKHNNKGFTLIETVAVLILIGILSAVAFSKLANHDIYNLVSQVDIIKSHLRYAQLKAMNSDKIWGVHCDGSSYWLFTDGNIDHKKQFIDEDDEVISLSANKVSMENFTLSFDFIGKPYSSANASQALSDDKTITVSSGSESKSIKIFKNTGFIK